MKTTVKTLDYEKVMDLPRPRRKKPLKPNWFWRILIRILCVFGLAGTGFTYKTEGMEKLGKNEPCLILMNHTCFLDMEIAQCPAQSDSGYLWRDFPSYHQASDGS